MNISCEEAISRCWAEVDLTQLATNYKNALAHLADGTQLICVLKADAYGLGAKAVARRLWQEGQRMFAVASYNEAAQIRRALPDSEVLVLGLCGRAQLEKAIDAGLLLTVFSEKYAREVIAAAKAAQKPARVHVKIETGLNRIGLAPETAADVIAAMNESGVIRLEGLFTHLALRDKASDRLQLDRLAGVRDALLARGIRIPMVHALDSIGMVRYPEDHMDAVRTGAWLYGVYPRGYAHPEESRLAITVKARIAQLHRVAAGECLGYDETHPVARESVVATLSCGYIDGYPRLNSVGEVEVCGRRAPVVGLVCMDQMMVDVTDIPEAQEDDEVILLGGSIGVDEYAQWGKLNRNESLARTGQRVPRVYIENGKVVDVTETME
ncbi:MAG: alanine racemase [Clostridiales bacterium]|nr:alanine racemase [Clostridiales bacterium]